MTMKLEIRVTEDGPDVMVEQWDYNTQQEVDDGAVIISPDLLVDEHRIRGVAGNRVEVFIHYGRKVVLRELEAEPATDSGELIPIGTGGSTDEVELDSSESEGGTQDDVTASERDKDAD